MCSACFKTEDFRGIHCFQTESVKCLLQNYIHRGLQCSLLLNLIVLTVIPSEISVKLVLVTLSNKMAPQTYTAKITEDRKPFLYCAYSPSLVKI